VIERRKTSQKEKTMNKYARLLKQTLELILSQDYEQRLVLETFQAGSTRMQSWFACECAYLYHLTGDLRYAKLARQGLFDLPERSWQTIKIHGSHEKGEFNLSEEAPFDTFALHPALEAYGWIRETDLVSPQEHKQFRSRVLNSCSNILAFLKHWSGAPEDDLVIGYAPWFNNHCQMAATALARVARDFPQTPERKQWTDWSKSLYTRLLEHMFFHEDTSNYFPIWWINVLIYAAEEQVEDTFYRHPGVRDIFQEILGQLDPSGFLPDYGDTDCFARPITLAAILEKGAAVYKCGEYKWAAWQILKHGERHGFFKKLADFVEPHLIKEDDQTGAPLSHFDQITEEAYGFIWASQWADKKVKEIQPKEGSKVLQQKVVLRGGWKKESLYMLLSSNDFGWHSHADAGAILSLTCRDKILLHDSGLYQKGRSFHNVVRAFRGASTAIFADLDKEMLPDERVSVESKLSRKGNIAVATLACRNYESTGLDYLRTVIMDTGQRLFRVTDELTLAGRAEGEFTIAQLWQTQSVTRLGEASYIIDSPLYLLLNQPEWPKLKLTLGNSSYKNVALKFLENLYPSICIMRVFRGILTPGQKLTMTALLEIVENSQ